MPLKIKLKIMHLSAIATHFVQKEYSIYYPFTISSDVTTTNKYVELISKKEPSTIREIKWVQHIKEYFKP
jgi:hypothetical protein